MRFFYTGAQAFLGEQTNPSLSLGGYISKSIVPNSKLNNLFGSITPYTLEKGSDEYIMLALKNELSNNIEDIKLNFIFSSIIPKFSDLKIAAIKNSSTNLFESIPSNTSAPYFAEFYSADSPNEVCIGNLKKGEYIGIWFKRSINKTEWLKLCQDQALVNKTFEDLKKEDIQLEINWTNV